MIVLSIREKHTKGLFTMDIWRTEHNDIAMTVYDAAGGPQFDFDLSDSDVEDLILLLERAKGSKPRTANKNVAEIN